MILWYTSLCTLLECSPADASTFWHMFFWNDAAPQSTFQDHFRWLYHFMPLKIHSFLNYEHSAKALGIWLLYVGMWVVETSILLIVHVHTNHIRVDGPFSFLWYAAVTSDAVVMCGDRMAGCPLSLLVHVAVLRTQFCICWDASDKGLTIVIRKGQSQGSWGPRPSDALRPLCLLIIVIVV